MSRPLGARKRTIYRPGTPSNDNGVYVEGPETTYEAVITVNALSGEKRQYIKDAFIREHAVMIGLSTSPIQTASDGHTGDQIEFKGKRFTFYEEKDQDVTGAPLKYYRYYLIASGVRSDD